MVAAVVHRNRQTTATSHEGIRRERGLTTSVVTLGDVVSVEDLVVVRLSQRIRVACAEGKIPFQLRLKPDEGETGDQTRLIVLAEDRDEMSETREFAVIKESARTVTRREGHQETYVSWSGIAINVV